MGVKRALLLAIALSLLVGPPSARGDTHTFRDGDEEPFCESPDPCPDTNFMDFRRVMVGHGKVRGTVRHGVRTHRRWRTRVLGGRYGVTIYLEINLEGGRRPEKMIRIRRKDGALWAQMFEGNWWLHRVPGSVGVWRPTRRSLKIAFDRDMLGEDVDRYGWSFSWGNRRTACPGSCHNDWAPDKGEYVHRLQRSGKT